MLKRFVYIKKKIFGVETIRYIFSFLCISCILYLPPGFVVPQIHQWRCCFCCRLFCVHKFAGKFGAIFRVFGTPAPLELPLCILPPDFHVTATVVQLTFGAWPGDAVHDTSRRYSINVSFFTNFWKKEKFYTVSYKDVVSISHRAYNFYRKKKCIKLIIKLEFRSQIDDMFLL